VTSNRNPCPADEAFDKPWPPYRNYIFRLKRVARVCNLKGRFILPETRLINAEGRRDKSCYL
jgi:hypothetical protein